MRINKAALFNGTYKGTFDEAGRLHFPNDLGYCLLQRGSMYEYEAADLRSHEESAVDHDESDITKIPLSRRLLLGRMPSIEKDRIVMFDYYFVDKFLTAYDELVSERRSNLFDLQRGKSALLLHTDDIHLRQDTSDRSEEMYRADFDPGVRKILGLENTVDMTASTGIFAGFYLVLSKPNSFK